MMMLGYLTAVLVLAMPVRLAGATPVTAPVVPLQAEAREHALLVKAAALLSRGRFDSARAIVGPLQTPAVVRVAVDWASVPPELRSGYQAAARSAVAAWNRAFGAAPRFQLTATEQGADVRVLFETYVAMVGPAESAPPGMTVSVPYDRNGGLLPMHLSCVDTSVDGVSDEGKAHALRRTATVRVSVNVPYSKRAHTTTSIVHLIGQGIGAYLGLSEAAVPSDVMGPDDDAGLASVVPSAEDVRRVRELGRVRAALLSLALRRVAVTVPTPAITVEKSEIDAGEVWQGETARYTFVVRNTGNAPLTIDARPSCGCTVTSGDTVVQPGAVGKIEAQLRTIGLSGRVMKSINVKSNDPERSQVLLGIGATVRQYVSFLPTDQPVVALNDAGSTTQEVEVRVHDTAAVSIRDVVSSARFVRARAVPMPAVGGDAAFNLVITVDPDAPNGRSVVRLVLRTSSRRAPEAGLTLTCEKGIIAAPVALYLGTIRPNVPLPMPLHVVLSRRVGSFHITRAISDDPHLELSRRTLQDGMQYDVQVKYIGGWGAGSVQRKLTIETDDPRQPRVEVPILATVSAGGEVRP